MGIAVVEREVRHPRIGRPRGVEEGFLIGLGSRQGGTSELPSGSSGAVERLIPVEEIGQAVGVLFQVARRDVVVARRGQEQGRASSGRPGDGDGSSAL